MLLNIISLILKLNKKGRRKRRSTESTDHLYGGHVLLQIIKGCPRCNLFTSLRAQNTASDSHPVTRILNPALQPRRVILQTILLINPAGNFSAAALARHHEPEDSETHEGCDDKQHHHQVKPERPHYMKARPNEAGEGDNEHDKTYHQKRCLEETLAGRAAPRHP